MLALNTPKIFNFCCTMILAKAVQCLGGITLVKLKIQLYNYSVALQSHN